MQHSARILTLIAVAVALQLGNPSTEASPAPALVITDASPLQEQQVRWALDRFEAAGLALPPLNISFHDGAGPCSGHPGLYKRRNGVAIIDICVSTNHVLLHELAHAWEGASVSDEVRDQFAGSWDLDNWNDHSVPWKERGIERAADTIAFVLEGLPDDPSPSLLRLACGYHQLTGQAAPELDRNLCTD